MRDSERGASGEAQGCGVGGNEGTREVEGQNIAKFGVGTGWRTVEVL